MSVVMPTIIPTKPKKGPKGRSRKRLFIIGGIVGFLLIGGVVFAFTPPGAQFYGSVVEKVEQLLGKTKPASDEDTNAVPPTATNTNEAYASASEDISQGKPQEATAAYQAKIDATQDKAEKAKLYMELSGAFLVYGTLNDLATALNYAQQAEQLDPTMQSAAQLAEVYEALQDTAQAEKYQQLVQDRDTSEWKDR